jgi:superfamily II DNA/RNA helicase
MEFVVPVTFAELGVPADLTAVLAKQQIERPFPIQEATLPDALAGLDVSGRAPTGSGKTLAFGLAVVAHVARTSGRNRPARRGRTAPSALILVPTRELAAQVEKTLTPLLAVVGARALGVYGGVGYGGQRAALRRGVEVIVGCPGRLEDLASSGDLVLDHVSIAVVDEADRMADMGFLPAVRRLLDRTREDRQTLLFSATLDGEVDVLVQRYQRQPRRHEVAESEEEQGDVRHAFWRVEASERVALVAQLVNAHVPAIVFCRTRHGADRLSQRLSAIGVSAAPIHGSRTQPQRDKALAAFKAGKVRALVATDVAARGIHVDAVACVIHFDPPADPKDYVHRSGRTGRAGADGLVVTLASSEVAKSVQAMQRALGLPVGLDRPDVAGLPTAPIAAGGVSVGPRPSGNAGAATAAKAHSRRRHPGSPAPQSFRGRRRPQRDRA